MLKLQPIEFFLRALPEGALFMFAVFVFSKTQIDIKKFLISSILGAISLFVIRMLPINYGVHTIIGMAMMIFYSVTINKIDVIKAIKSILIYVIIQFVAEGANIVIIQNILNKNINEVFSDPVLKIVYGIPSLIFLFVITITYHYIEKKKGELSNVK